MIVRKTQSPGSGGRHRTIEFCGLYLTSNNTLSAKAYVKFNGGIPLHPDDLTVKDTSVALEDDYLVGVGNGVSGTDIISKFNEDSAYIKVYNASGAEVTNSVVGTGYTVNLVVDNTAIKTINIQRDITAKLHASECACSVPSYGLAACEGDHKYPLNDWGFGAYVRTLGTAAETLTLNGNCYKLDGLNLPYGLETIGAQAFYRCESLTAVTLPKYVRNVGASVFAYCKNLIRVEISSSFGALPEWTFYGCENLTIVVLPETVSSVNNYAFTQCDSLTTVYYNGEQAQKEQIQMDIIKDIPWFESAGYISNGTPSASTTSGQYIENKNGTVTQKNTTVSKDENKQVVSVVQHTHAPGPATGGSLKADITITVENKDAWSAVADIIDDTIKDVSDTSALMGAELGTVGVTLYVKTEGTVDENLVESLAGDDVKMTVVVQNGSEFRMELEDIKTENLSGNYDYSYTLGNASKENCDQLGTDDCFGLTFKESAKINAEVVIPLPENEGASNAYLYQVEEDNTLTRLQAVAVDKNGNAHFYLGAVDKDTQYVIGVNVPNEKTDDVIIPDELLMGDDPNQSAIERLQKIDYVITGRESSWGMGAAQVTWIMLAVIAGCIIVVGVIMAIWNQRRLKRGYVPDLEGEIE